MRFKPAPFKPDRRERARIRAERVERMRGKNGQFVAKQKSEN